MPAPPTTAPARSPSGSLTLLLVAVGGAAGSCARYGVALLAPAGPGGLPVATLTVNVLGGLLLGVLLGARPDDPVLRPLLGTGFLGGFTTFSAFALEVDRLAGGAPWVAAAHLVGTTAVGLAAAAAGLRLGRRLKATA